MQNRETAHAINKWLRALPVVGLLAVLPGCMGEYAVSPEEGRLYAREFEVGQRYRLEQDVYFEESDSRYYEYLVRQRNTSPKWPPSVAEYRDRPEKFWWVDLALEEGTVLRVTGVTLSYSTLGTYAGVVAEVEDGPHADTRVDVSLIADFERDRDDEALRRTAGHHVVRDPAYMTPVSDEADTDSDADP